MNKKQNGKPKLSKDTLKTAKRLLKYVTETYKMRFILVFVCILISSVATISVSLSLKFLLDDFIIPLIGQQSPDFAELYRALAVLGCIFLLGVVSTFIYTRMMVYIGQGVLKKVRDDMFEHMQTLPIRYFDQRTNGSIMSLYTNDTDTLRQMISQAIPQALMSFFTIIVTFISMVALSPLLTLLAIVVIFVMIFVTRKIGGNSGKYFVSQQMSLADVTGFVEERMNGQRDEGYVTLVNARKDENGNIAECKERTGMWAWKHPHSADGSVSYTELTGDVVFENVTFGYNEDKVILKDISLYAKPGQKLAFVGSTGAGKTTITNLINRFYDIQEGKIRYDGINITKIKKDDLRCSLGIVLQDTHLFTGTIMDNIRYGKLDATDEEVYQAARLAHADQFIQMLPNGYQTMLSGDGEELSQGQRQLLSIARAAVADPPVLILDEATSSIDTRTESIVQKGMDNLMKGRTVFVIAHRLSTIRNSNAIIVLDHGKIIERGDHEDLIKMKGTYYQLYTGKLELS